MRVLVTGAGGLVGRAVIQHCTSLGDEVFGYTHGTLDITDSSLLHRVIDQRQPDAVINCAAWTDVDSCESDRKRAFLVNARGPENLANASGKAGALLVTISTDYVFDGTKAGFYTQRDDPNPQTVYGLSKLQGERRAQLACAATVIVRTGFIFGQGGKNFLSTVIERARRGEKLKVINDARGTPTYAGHLAGRLRDLAQLALPGIYHVVNSGTGASFEDYARVALKMVKCEATILESVSMMSLGRPAPRPKNSCLKCLLSPAIGLPALPLWQDALREFMESQKQVESVIRG